MSPEQAPTEPNGRVASWLAVLEEYDVRFLILNTRRDHQLLHLIQSQPQWTIDLVDGDTMLFARSREQPAEAGLKPG